MKRLFVELKPFRNAIDTILGAELMIRDLQGTLLERPEAGDLIEGTGGLRKIRLALPNRGKRDACRVTYLYVPQTERIYLVTIYAKNEKSDLSRAEKHELKKLVLILKSEERAR